MKHSTYPAQHSCFPKIHFFFLWNSILSKIRKPQYAKTSMERVRVLRAGVMFGLKNLAPLTFHLNLSGLLGHGLPHNFLLCHNIAPSSLSLFHKSFTRSLLSAARNDSRCFTWESKQTAELQVKWHQQPPWDALHLTARNYLMLSLLLSLPRDAYQ